MKKVILPEIIASQTFGCSDKWIEIFEQHSWSSDWNNNKRMKEIMYPKSLFSLFNQKVNTLLFLPALFLYTSPFKNQL